MIGLRCALFRSALIDLQLQARANPGDAQVLNVDQAVSCGKPTTMTGVIQGAAAITGTGC